MITLNQLKCGEQAAITGFAKSEKAYRQKLLAMGLTPGTVITLSRIAPLGDPVEILVRGYALTLRKLEAEAMRIERL